MTPAQVREIRRRQHEENEAEARRQKEERRRADADRQELAKQRKVYTKKREKAAGCTCLQLDCHESFILISCF